MIRPYFQRATASAVVALCCSCSAQPASTPQSGGAKQEPIQVRLDELKCRRPVLLESLHRFDAAAQRAADPAAHRVAWQEAWHDPRSTSNREWWMDYRAMWCLQSSNLDHLCAHHSARPVHCIKLYAWPHPRSPQGVVTAFELRASRHPDGPGWGVCMTYDAQAAGADSTKSDLHVEWSVVFYNDQIDSRPFGSILTIPGGGVRIDKRFGDLAYHVTAPIHLPPRRGPRKFLASAESFRDAGLADANKLEALIREQIATGKAAISVTDASKLEARTEGGTDGGHPPQPVYHHPTFGPPLPAEYELAEEQKQEILDEATQEMQRRRRLFREHYQEMYAAMQATFPLNECLAAEAKN